MGHVSTMEKVMSPQSEASRQVIWIYLVLFINAQGVIEKLQYLAYRVLYVCTFYWLGLIEAY
jgi:hypothetical protein